MKEPMVNVKMTTYNHEPYIAQAIEGVLTQKTSFPLELVIGEDCSTDGTREIVFEYQKKYPDIIRVITSDNNIGMYENGRRTEDACRGEYLAYCEGDDYWNDPEKMQKQVTFLERNPDYSMVHSNADQFFAESGEYVKSAQYKKQELKPDELNDTDSYLEIVLTKRWIWTPTVCVRKSVLDEILRCCPECRDTSFMMGDFQRWLELSRRGKVKYFTESMATKNELVESASHSKDSRKLLRYVLGGNSLVEHYLKKYPCSPDINRQVRIFRSRFTLGVAWKALEAEIALEHYERLKKLGAKLSLVDRLRTYAAGHSGVHKMFVFMKELVGH